MPDGGEDLWNEFWWRDKIKKQPPPLILKL